MTRNFSNSSISYKDGIITSTLHGIFNESSAEEYKEQLFELVMGLNKSPLHFLLILVRWKAQHLKPLI